MIDCEMIFQHFPGFQGNIRHLVKFFGRFPPQPFIYLLCAERFFPMLNEESLELFKAQFTDVSFGRGDSCFAHFTRTNAFTSQSRAASWKRRTFPDSSSITNREVIIP